MAWIHSTHRRKYMESRGDNYSLSKMYGYVDTCIKKGLRAFC